MQNLSVLTQGLADSKVRLLIWEDLQCGDCARLHRLIEDKLLKAYGPQIAIEFHDFPLPKHDWARPAAMASRHFLSINPSLAAEFRADVLANLTQLSTTALEAWVRAFARRHNLDESVAAGSLSNADLGAQVDQDYQAGIGLGVRKTPTAFLGPIAFIEKFYYEDLALMVLTALKRNKD